MSRLLVLGFLLVLAACQDPKLTLQQPAPELVALNLAGQATKLENLRGQPALLVFWSSSCGVCLAEMPNFSKLAKTHARQARVVLINTDKKKPDFKKFAESYGTDIVWLHDQLDATQARYKVSGTPTFITLDAKGVLVAQHAGSIKAKQLEALLKAAL